MMKLAALDCSWLEGRLAAAREALEASLKKHAAVFDMRMLYHAVAGGKRLRHFLVLTVSEALGGDRKKAMDYGAAVELAHAASLVHDDILDGDVRRRGEPSFLVKYGLRNGILFPHELVSYSLALLGNHGLDEVALLYETLGRMARGARHDFAFNDITLEEHYSKTRLKTASLFGAACELGSMAAGRREFQGIFYEHGLELVTDFQIADDVVDVMRTIAEVGPVGDMRDGSLSLPLVLLWLGAPGRRGQIQELLAGGGAHDFSALAGEMNGIVKDCLEISEEHVRNARRILEELDLEEGSKEALLSLPRYVVQKMLAEGRKVGHDSPEA